MHKVEVGVMSWSYELELESGMYFLIREVSIRLISEANASTSLIASIYPSVHKRLRRTAWLFATQSITFSVRI